MFGNSDQPWSFLSNYMKPGIVNRTFENRIEFGNRTKSNTDSCVSSIFEPIEQIELNPLDCVRLSSATEHNRTQSNGWRLIVVGE